MKLFATGQIAAIDQYTIMHEPISGIDLMERAARAMYDWLRQELSPGSSLVFFAGPGNNGGDALALARMFAQEGHTCRVYLPDQGKALSGAAAVNLQRLAGQVNVTLTEIHAAEDFPVLLPEVPVIDGLFGSGLTRALTGLNAALVRHINHSSCMVYSIDIPSGLMGEDNRENDSDAIIRAFCTLTLQFPKLSMLFPENYRYTGEVHEIGIGLHPAGIDLTESPYSMTTTATVRSKLPVRERFAHKGTYGHALLIAGSYGKLGAAVLAAQGCLRSGAGLLTAHLPEEGYGIMQAAVPEVMCSVDPDHHVFSKLPDLAKYSAVGAGPGLGTRGKTAKALKDLLQKTHVPLVLDADALNLIADEPGFETLIPAGSVLTPHPGEFRRLFGDSGDSWSRLQLQREMARKLQSVIVLKGAYTSIALPNGSVSFNPTGNPGMATGGSGDVLTGLILGLLAQGLTPGDAAVAGVYIHGLAGDIAARKKSMPALIASDIVRSIGEAFRNIYDTKQSDF